MKGFLMVFLGGGLGSALRYCIHRLMASGSISFPYSTLTVNITGSLLLGILIGYNLKGGHLSSTAMLFLATGFCGGFTTFSTFVLENHNLLRTGDYLNFSLYTFGSLALGIGAILLGLLVTKYI